jgi:hypothetical protein
VEVIDERTSVLILSSVLHPDLGALKKSVEANQQRQAEITLIKDVEKIDINDFQLVILYQPNNNFKNVIAEFRRNDINYLLVTGTKTDWNFINSVMKIEKDLPPSLRIISPVYNSNYSNFQFEDIGFKSLPPLQDISGIWNLRMRIIMFCCINNLEGVATTTPLLATFEEGGSRYAALFGENIWRWRAQSFADTGSFENFDDFFGKLVQYLSSTQKRDRLNSGCRQFLC